MSEQAPAPDLQSEEPGAPSPLKWALFGCIGCGIFGLCLLAFLVLVALGAEAAQQSAVAEAHRHLQLVKNAQAPEAYAATAPAFQSATDLKTFEAFVAQQGALYQSTDLTFDQRQVNDDVATLRGHATAEDGTNTPVRFVVVKVEETWMVRDIKIGE